MAMLPQEIIRKKRDGGVLAASDIQAFIAGLVDGRVTEGQAAAFAMAIFFRGLALEERVSLTRAMMASGQILDWDLPGPVLDKHSTGGVGDCVSLPLGPAVAACGGFVPMISGRGLGQTADLAPADKRLYAIRDVTATVESLDLITASILSKKLAAGLQGLAMDVKFGSGAFMVGLDDARALAQSLVAVANGAGLKTHALLTDMDQPLASAAGNAVEVAYCIDYLTGKRREPRFHEATVALGAEMLVLGHLAGDRDEGTRMMEEAVSSGRAAEAFARMVAALGGPADILERADAHLPQAAVTLPVHAAQAGVVERVETRAVGIAVVALGGGRARAQDTIDPAVGLTDLAPVGETVGEGRPLCVVHARDADTARAAADAVRAAFTIGAGPVAARPVVLERVEG